MRWFVLTLSIGCSTTQQPVVAKTQPVQRQAPVAKQRYQETSTQEVMLTAVKKVIRSAQAEVRGCYEAILTPLYHPDVDLTLRLVLRADGTVRRVEVVKMKPDVAGLVACFGGVLADLRFPKDTEDWELEFPVKLRSGGLAADVEDATPPQPNSPSPK